MEISFLELTTRRPCVLGKNSRALRKKKLVANPNGADPAFGICGARVAFRIGLPPVDTFEVSDV
jgi:hypothetical protein